MRRQTHPFLGLLPLLLAPVIFQAASCRSAPAVFTDPYAETYLRKAEIPLWPENNEQSPRFNLVLALPDFPEDPALARLTSDLFYEGKELQVYGNDLIAAYRNQYMEARDGLTGEAPPGEAMNWEYAETVDLWTLPGEGPLVVLSRTREYYLGGAHGMQEKKYAVIDRTLERQILLKDMIRAGEEKALGLLVEKALRDRVGLDGGAPLEEGGYFADPPAATENFFITPQGLGFHWDPYEIGPYMMGPVEIIIPMEDIKKLVSPRILPFLTKKP
jgi:hypothetical protein